MPLADYDAVVAEVGDVIVDFASRRFITATMVAERLGWTRSAATAVLRRLEKAGRLEAHRRTKVPWSSWASLNDYQVGPVEYRTPRSG
jgi:hypothetical protein